MQKGRFGIQGELKLPSGEKTNQISKDRRPGARQPSRNGGICAADQIELPMKETLGQMNIFLKSVDQIQPECKAYSKRGETIGDIPRIKRGEKIPWLDIRYSTRHLEVAMALAAQMQRSNKKAPLVQSYQGSDVGRKYGASADADCEEIAQLRSQFRKRCALELAQARNFLKCSRESLTIMPARENNASYVIKNESQIAYQQSLLGFTTLELDDVSCASSTGSARNFNTVDKAPAKFNAKARTPKTFSNNKKQQREMRKQAGVLICRHLLAALRIQDANDRHGAPLEAAVGNSVTTC
jgi:hypothetical protein